MSELLTKILDDVKAAMKAGEKEKLTTLRGVHSDIKNKSINSKQDITDEMVLDVVSKGVKQRNDAIEQFQQGGRDDLVNQNKTEIEWLNVYLPAQLTPEEVEVLVKEAIAETGASSKKEMGKVMGFLMPKTKGKVDGKLLSQTVSSLLS